MRPIKPSCPKCGYDQTGIIDSWTDRCPVRGQCTECGLEFDWADVLDPSRVDAKWHVECMRNRRRVVLYPFGMFVRLVFPWIYWERTSRLKNHRLARLVLWLISVAVWMHLIAGVIFFVLLFEISRLSSWKTAFGGGFAPGGTHPSVWEFITHAKATWWIDSATSSVIGIGGESAVSMFWGEVAYAYALVLLFINFSWLILMAGLRVTRREFEIGWRDIVRAFLVSQIAPMAMCELGGVVSVVDEYLERIHQIDWISMGGGNFLLLVLAFVLFLWVQSCWLSAVRVGWLHRPAWALCGLGFVFSMVGMVGLVMALGSLMS